MSTNGDIQTTLANLHAQMQALLQTVEKASLPSKTDTLNTELVTPSAEISSWVNVEVPGNVTHNQPAEDAQLQDTTQLQDAAQPETAQQADQQATQQTVKETKQPVEAELKLQIPNENAKSKSDNETALNEYDDMPELVDDSDEESTNQESTNEASTNQKLKKDTTKDTPKDTTETKQYKIHVAYPTHNSLYDGRDVDYSMFRKNLSVISAPTIRTDMYLDKTKSWLKYYDPSTHKPLTVELFNRFYNKISFEELSKNPMAWHIMKTLPQHTNGRNKYANHAAVAHDWDINAMSSEELCYLSLNSGFKFSNDILENNRLEYNKQCAFTNNINAVKLFNGKSLEYLKKYKGLASIPYFTKYYIIANEILPDFPAIWRNPDAISVLLKNILEMNKEYFARNPAAAEYIENNHKQFVNNKNNLSMNTGLAKFLVKHPEYIDWNTIWMNRAITDILTGLLEAE